MLRELLAELNNMFFGEKRLTMAVFAIVTATALLIDFVGLNELLSGAFLLFGCLSLLVENVCRSARAHLSRRLRASPDITPSPIARLRF